MKTFLTLVLLFVTTSLQAQTFICNAHVTASTCTSRSRKVDAINRNFASTNARIAKVRIKYDEAIQRANLRYSESIQRADERAQYSQDHCRSSYERSMYYLSCYDGIFYNDCDYKIENINYKFSNCKSVADDREKRAKDNAAESYARRTTLARERYDRLNAAYQAKNSRDQIRLNDAKSELDRCTACLQSQQPPPGN